MSVMSPESICPTKPRFWPFTLLATWFFNQSGDYHLLSSSDFLKHWNLFKSLETIINFTICCFNLFSGYTVTLIPLCNFILLLMHLSRALWSWSTSTGYVSAPSLWCTLPSRLWPSSTSAALLPHPHPAMSPQDTEQSNQVKGQYKHGNHGEK